MNYVKDLKAVFDWIKSNIKFYGDIQAVETFQEAFHTAFLLKGGDCDDLVILGAALLESIGYKTKLFVVRYKDRPFHIYMKVGIPPITPYPLRWLPFDTSHKQIGFGQSYKALTNAEALTL